jgi:hypothetical protein
LAHCLSTCLPEKREENLALLNGVFSNEKIPYKVRYAIAHTVVNNLRNEKIHSVCQPSLGYILRFVTDHLYVLFSEYGQITVHSHKKPECGYPRLNLDNLAAFFAHELVPEFPQSPEDVHTREALVKNRLAQEYPALRGPKEFSREAALAVLSWLPVDKCKAMIAMREAVEKNVDESGFVELILASNFSLSQGEIIVCFGFKRIIYKWGAK